MNTELDLGMAIETGGRGKGRKGEKQKCLLESHTLTHLNPQLLTSRLASLLTPDVIIFANEFERILSLLQQNAFCTHV